MPGSLPMKQTEMASDGKMFEEAPVKEKGGRERPVNTR